MVGSTTSPEKSTERPACTRSAVGQEDLHAAVAAVAGLAHLLEFVDADREVDVHLVDLVDGGEQRGIALPDQRAFGDLLLARAPADGRTHGGITQVYARRIHRRPAREPRGGCRAFRGERVVEVCLRNELLRRQRARAFRRGVRVGVVGVCGRERSFGLAKRGLQRRRIDHEEQLALRHVAAFSSARRWISPPLRGNPRCDTRQATDEFLHQGTDGLHGDDADSGGGMSPQGDAVVHSLEQPAPNAR